MKKFVICILTLLVLVPLAPLAASADTLITNQTEVLPYYGGSMSTGYNGGNWISTIPPASMFPIFGYSVGYTDASKMDVKLNIYTNMPQGGDTSPPYPPVGDLFLNIAGAGFTQALVLPTSGSGGTLKDASTFQTSKDLWQGPGGLGNGYYYGGEYHISPTSATSGLVPVQATGTAVSSNITASWSDNPTASGHPGTYILSILFPGMDDNQGKDLIFLWSSGTCGNGTIYGDVNLTQVSLSPVPVPPSALLLGTGLLGLGILRKWRLVR